MTPDTSDFFSGYAHGFDSIYEDDKGFIKKTINRLFRKSMRLRYQMALAECSMNNGKTVIDVGCGPGHYGIALATLGLNVTGIDFSKKMIDIARQKADKAGFSDKCKYIAADFIEHRFEDKFDYAIAMGFMDYIENPRDIISGIISITRKKALFSFPRSKGLLAWQRRMRYKKRCSLFMYKKHEIESLFEELDIRELKIAKIARDYFVTVIIS